MEEVKSNLVRNSTNRHLKNGRDEKGCKMDVDGRRRASTIDGLEKCSLVDVYQEKCSGVDVDRSRSTLTK